jgi:FKBP-type peptidyl-prolyl cis-trans isomerase FklB
VKRRFIQDIISFKNDFRQKIVSQFNFLVSKPLMSALPSLWSSSANWAPSSSLKVEEILLKISLFLRFKILSMNVSKTILVFAGATAIAFSGLAQTTAKPAANSTTPAHKTGTTTTAAPFALKNESDSISYAIGVSLANFYKQQNISNINTTILVHAVKDVEANKAILSEQQCQSTLMSYVTKQQTEKASGNKKLGQDFLAANAKKPGIVTLPDGLQYQVLKTGAGPKPKLTDMVRVHYHGTLIDGRVFDSSVDRGQPIELNVNGVIPGWTEALQLMPVGSKWKLFVPSDLAYGDRQAGQLIAPGSTLVFDVELLDIVNQTPPPIPHATPDTTAKPDSTKH